MSAVYEYVGRDKVDYGHTAYWQRTDDGEAIRVTWGDGLSLLTVYGTQDEQRLYHDALEDARERRGLYALAVAGYFDIAGHQCAVVFDTVFDVHDSRVTRGSADEYFFAGHVEVGGYPQSFQLV